MGKYESRSCNNKINHYIFSHKLNFMYKYWGFGVNIASDIEFPELLKNNFKTADVAFVVGKVPTEIEGETVSAKQFSYQINDRELLFSVHDVAKYYAAEGNQVVIEPSKPEDDSREVRLYVLATVMASILLQRNRLPLHASAIKKNGGLVLITGDSRAGKSTSLAGLLKKGYTVFSDDVIVLQKEEAQVLAKASYPMVKLWNDTLTKMNHPMFEDRSFRIQKDIDKYGLFFHDRFDKKSYPVKKVFVLKVGNSLELTSQILTGKKAFDALIMQIYRPMLIQNNAQRLLCFTLVTDIIKNGSIIEICRPVECNTEDLINFIESQL